MGLHPGRLETPIRRSFNAAFTYIVAILTTSLLGSLTALTIVFSGHGLLATVTVLRTSLDTGIPPSARETTSRFFEAAQTHAWTGLGTSTILVGLVVLTVTNVFALTTGEFVITLLATVALLVIATCWLSLGYFLVLLERTHEPTKSTRDALLLTLQNPTYSLLLALVTTSIAILNTLSIIGFFLIGYSFILLTTLLATDHLYNESGGERIIAA